MPERILESPSKQKKADRCQLFMQLTYLEQWEPKEAHHSLVPRLRGTAFSKACELIHKEMQASGHNNLDTLEFQDEVVRQSLELFGRQYEYCQDKGIVFPHDSDALVREELRRVIPLYCKHTPVRSWAKVHGVEHKWEDYGCRVDVFGTDMEGDLVIPDVKYKSSLESRYLTSTLTDYKEDAQFIQYNKVYRLVNNLPDDALVYSQVILVVGHPFRIHNPKWLYRPETLQLWYTRAQQLTKDIQQIEAGERIPAPSLTHKDMFGVCPMKEACLDFHLSEGPMLTKYVKLGRLPE